MGLEVENKEAPTARESATGDGNENWSMDLSNLLWPGPLVCGRFPTASPSDRTGEDAGRQTNGFWALHTWVGFWSSYIKQMHDVLLQKNVRCLLNTQQLSRRIPAAHRSVGKRACFPPDGKRTLIDANEDFTDLCCHFVLLRKKIDDRFY